VSRTRRAAIAAVFGYLQFGLALVSGIALVPFVLSRVPTELYGVWLAVGEVLAYSAMVDLGVVGVIPWLVAESDGRGDRAAIRGLLAGGLAFASAAAVAFLVVATLAFTLVPKVANLTEAQRAGVSGPLLLLALGVAAALPLRTFYAAVMGLQDVTFAGILSVTQLALGISLTVGLLLGGYGLYALAVAATAPSLLGGLACLCRLAMVAPDLLTAWRLPGWPAMRSMMAQGLGSWTAGLGWRMVAASDSIVILSVMGPAAAVVYAMTFKLGAVAMQMSWQLPDAGLVGLAQLKGEGRPDRVREVTLSMLRLVLITSGGVACAILAFNPAFVTLWVGEARFGGMALNALLAGVVIAHSLGHGLFTTSATLGTRVQAGWAALAQGAVNLAAALLLGRLFGLAGIALAAIVSTALVAYPAGVWMVRKTTEVDQAALWRRALGPWVLRGAGLLALGAAVGALGTRVSPWLPLALAPVLGVLYLWVMRPLYVGIPLPARVRPWLTRLRLLPELGG
jgi:O-antigen/teichoic acid export membrane protein